MLRSPAAVALARLDGERPSVSTTAEEPAERLRRWHRDQAAEKERRAALVAAGVSNGALFDRPGDDAMMSRMSSTGVLVPVDKLGAVRKRHVELSDGVDAMAVQSVHVESDELEPFASDSAKVVSVADLLFDFELRRSSSSRR